MITTSLKSIRTNRVDLTRVESSPLSPSDLNALEKLDLAYRTLCAMLYNYAPMSGHPGGSISAGRIVSTLWFGTMDYDALDPERDDADVLAWAAGHKALGLYAMSALRSEILRIAGARIDSRRVVRLEDLLGFRRNPTNPTPLFRLLGARALDGHPTPATPFVPFATGASGVGMAASLGYALAAFDWFGDDAPKIHILEGEAGLTPGRVAEALAFAGTASLGNVIVHVDWNQSSIDSDHVTREGSQRGDYVQWDPAELFLLHDWNVLSVSDGTNLQQISAAHRRALRIDNDRPTVIVYRTQKGWLYGIEGRASHGAGHKLCSPGFLEALAIPAGGVPRCENSLCNDGTNATVLESCFWQSLEVVRHWLEGQPEMIRTLANRMTVAKDRLESANRKPRATAPALNMSLKDLDAAQKAIKEKQSLPEAYTTQREALEEAKKRRDEHAAKRAELNARRTHLVRASRRVPLERKRAQLVALVASLGGVARHAARIMSLHSRLGAYDQAKLTERAARAEAQKLRDRVGDAARRAGVPSGSTEKRIDGRTESRIQRLLQERARRLGARA